MLIPTSRLVVAALAAALAGSALPASAQGQAPGLLRGIGLAELGFPAGVVIEGLGATRDLFIPVPGDAVGVQGARLALRLESHAVFAGRRGVEVLANGRLLLARPLAQGGERLELDLPVTVEDIARGNGFLRVTIRTPGALTENRCLDQRLAGDRLVVLPGTRLDLRLATDAPRTVAQLLRLMPPEVTVLTRPGTLQPAEAAAALTAAQAIAATGRRVSFSSGAPPAAGEGGAWTSGAVLVGRAETQATEGGEARVVRAAGLPAIAIGGAEPGLAARLLSEPWRDAAAAPALQAHAIATRQAAGERNLPLTRFRGDLAAQDVADRGTWTVEFSARDLPAGMAPAAFALDIAAAPDTGEERPVASVFLNDLLIGGQVLGARSPDRLRVAIPTGATGLENRLRVVVQRRPRGGECDTLPVASPAQLLPSSALVMAPADTAPADFFELAPRLRQAVTILTDAAPTAEALAPMLSVLRTQAAPGAAITFAGSTAAPTAPFIAFTAAAPTGLRTPPVRFDRGRVMVADRNGRVLLDIAAEAAPTVAQLVATTSGIVGIWVRRPEQGTALPPVLALDRGDVVIADAGGVALAWASGREGLVRVSYPDAPSLWTVLEQYRPWIVGGIWLAVTALVIGGFVRVWRRRNARAGGGA